MPGFIICRKIKMEEMMVTTKDVAKEAGVSQGTVSNVLNRTGKVSSEKIARVEAAIRKLGYKANSQAQKLKMGSGRSVAAVLPSIEIPHYLSFFENLRKTLFQNDIDTTLHITEDLPAMEKKCIERIYEERPALIITCSSLQSALPYQEGIPVLFLDRFPSGLKDYQRTIGFRYIDAGRAIGRYLAEKGYRDIALLTSPSPAHDISQFQIGLDEGLAGTGTIDLFRSDYSRIAGKAMELASKADKFDAIVTIDRSRAEAIMKASTYSQKVLPPIVTLSENTLFHTEGIKPYILDYGRLGRAVGAEISDYLDKEAELTDLILPELGFIEDQKLNKIAGKKLSILTLNSPATESLERLLPDFTRKTGIEVSINAHPYEELYRIASDPDTASTYDLFRVDMAWIPEIAEKTFRKLDASSPEISGITSRFLQEIGDEYSSICGDMYALPFDPSVQLMFYNAEAFSNEMAKRLYYERYREKMEEPQDFGQYDKIASFFTKSLNPDSPTLYGHAMTLGTSVAAACDFLPRLDAAGRPFRDILKDTETAKALREYIDSAASTDGKINPWWDDTISSFSEGCCAMLRVFMNHAPRITNSKHSNVVGKIGFAQIPGGHPLLGGGSIGLARESNAYEESIEFLKWVYSYEISRLYTLFGGTSPNAAIYDDPEILSIYPWLSIAKEGFRKGRRRFVCQDEAKEQRMLEEILGMAVRSAASRAMTAEEALKTACHRYDSLRNKAL